MSHGLLDVLSVWWIKVAFDLIILYCFLAVAKNKKDQNNYYTQKTTIKEDLIP